ncbi:uncharacterized protein E0L32_011823 [Thyridium curvatum]|uniref:Endoglucanase EG-II n=1 Tax=Thyridium curvatum TaxID=1093900 RepID=A0A507BKT8_9PEZI|nr:uncharacterized protein E0L32_011823 [Thyridium curvatum]TPX18099.1 hypothetical protein E0L32_011823 [Thyridium curvatum]
MFVQHLGLLAALFAVAQAKVQYLVGPPFLRGSGKTCPADLKPQGIAIAGIDFGCDIDGTCPVNSGSFPLSGYGGSDGEGQMKHFVTDNGLNMFRLPVSWQYLLHGKSPGDKFDQDAFARYDKLMQACLNTGAYCMIDMHNFARFDGGIIGQGGPTNDQFGDLWSQLATAYASDKKVVFGLMNEPHDLDIKLWSDTCQAAVTAIRKAGADKQMILLPGTNFDSAATLVSTGSAEALLKITNPDGSNDGLLLDIHKYLDENNSGQHAQCTTNNTEAFTELAAYLRKQKRIGMVSETGASSDSSCMTAFCAQNKVINDNSDVYVGLVAWAAGSFGASYVLSLTPTRQGDRWVNNELFSKCVLAPWENSEGGTSSSSTTATATRSATKPDSSSTATVSSATRTPTDNVGQGVATDSKDAPSSATFLKPLTVQATLSQVACLLLGGLIHLLS